MKMLYFAYGANTNIGNMAQRCPDAYKIGNYLLQDYELVFKGVADINYVEGSAVQGVVWQITDKCEAALDIYEGYPHLYRKEYVRIFINDQPIYLMFYKMWRHKLAPPSRGYFNTIKDGYISNGLDLEYLYASVERFIEPASISNKT